MTRYKSSETRGVLAKTYCYFVRQYSGKKNKSAENLRRTL